MEPRTPSRDSQPFQTTSLEGSTKSPQEHKEKSPRICRITSGTLPPTLTTGGEDRKVGT